MNIKLFFSLIVSVGFFVACGQIKSETDLTTLGTGARTPLPERVMTESSSPVLDKDTIAKLKTSRFITHRFSDGRVISFYNGEGDAIEIGGDIILAPFVEIPEKIAEHEQRIADRKNKVESQPSSREPSVSGSQGNATTQGVGIRPNSCVPSFLDGVCLFQSGVPYIIDSSINGDNYSKVINAINLWNSTAVGVKYRPQVNASEPWVRFRLTASECSSNVGRYQSSQTLGFAGQNINLSPGNCIDTQGTIMHEMGHAAGLWHEQQRCDRDTYMSVVSSNDINFGKRCESNVAQYGQLDFDSVMFYGFGTFVDVNQNFLGTISQKFGIPTTYDGNPSNAPQRTLLSLGDQSALNSAYQLTNSPFTIAVQAHGASYGWQPWRLGNTLAGTTGQGLRIEAFRIAVKGARPGLGVSYGTFASGLGWLPAVNDSGVAGTTGSGRQLEAFYVNLTGNRAGCSVTYQAHVAGIGWQPSVAEGNVAGTTGQNRRMEAMVVVVNCS